MLLEVVDIYADYGQARCLKGVSLKVESGEIVSLIGSNGAGKTTTLKTLIALKGISKGEIKFDGQRIENVSTQNIVKKGIALIPEGRRVFPFMTVQENLKMGGYVEKNGKEIVKRINSLTDHFPILKNRKSQLAGSLSGGEQQMLAIARALMSKPRLLLMDEPSLGLSPVMVIEVGKIISEINTGGVTVLLVEQNARLALKVADRGYVMQIGNIVLEGKSEELINNALVKRIYLGE